jgi:hypothetical protein
MLFGAVKQMPAMVTAYLVAATVVMPVYGKHGDSRREGGRSLALVRAAYTAAVVDGPSLGGLRLRAR